MLLEVRINVVRFGNEFARVGCMLLTLFRASRRVRNRDESGKLERAVMSLSVKSMASWSYSNCSATMSQYSLVAIKRLAGKEGRVYNIRGGREGEGEKTNFGDTQILNCGYFMSCSPHL